MRGSNKGDEPPELRDWKAEQIRNGIAPEYRNLQQPERDATEQSLFAEQTGAVRVLWTRHLAGKEAAPPH